MTTHTVTLYTDGSTAPKNPGPSGYGFYAVYEDGSAYDGYGPIGELKTNNVAELLAAFHGISFLLTLPDIKKIIVISDSSYFIDGTKSLNKWKLKQWKTSTEKEVANKEEWILLDNLFSTAKNNTIELVFKWVRGHNGNVGNTRADNNANLGRKAVLDKALEPVIIFNEASDKPIAIITDTATKKAKAKTITESRINPLVNANKWIFDTNRNYFDTATGYYVYTLSSYKESDKLAGKNIGKPNPNTRYSIVLLKEPIKELEKIKVMYNNVFEGGNVPISGDLAKITQSKIWGTLMDDNATALKGRTIVHESSTALSKIIYPPLLVFRLEEIFTKGMLLLSKAFISKTNTDSFIVDITDKLIDVSDKGKLSVKSSYTNTARILEINDIAINEAIPTFDVKLIPGTDLITRGGLSNLIKYYKTDIKLYLLLTDLVIKDTPIKSYNVATVIEAGGDKAIYYSADSSYRIIKQ